MRILITGANGFVGEAVVREAVRAGHEVIALVRPHSLHRFGELEACSGESGGSLKLARVDLRDRPALRESLTGVESVIHLAASKAGDFYTQLAGTVGGTESLLEAMQAAGVNRLVAVSSFSVYDFEKIPSGAELSESSPIVTRQMNRDDYSQTKRIQEDLCRTYGSSEREVVVIRPGMIYGPFELWHALLGANVGKRFFRVGRKAQLPMTYTTNTAAALVLAATVPGAAGKTINIVDDNPPTQDEYARLAKQYISTPPTVVIPWSMMRLFTKSLDLANQRFWSGKAKLPGILVDSRVQARFKPLRYPNTVAREVLGWKPMVTLECAIKESAEAERVAAPPQ